MKAIIKSLLAAGVIGMTASCTDLDLKPESQYTEYPSSEIAQEAKLADVYFHLRGTLGRRYMEAQGLSSDEWVGYSFGASNYWDQGTYQHACQHNYSPDDATIDWYEDVTSGITKANTAIAEMGAESAGAAAARAMRAYYHWILVDCYGDSPLLDRKMEEGDVVTRQSRSKVIHWVADELESIIPQLTTDVTTNTYGKPTRWMVEALLAKIYINWPVYTAATADAYDANKYDNPKLLRIIELCDDIIKSGKFDLVGGAEGHKCGNTYRAKFTPDNGPQIKDFIYAMPYDAITQQGFQYGRPRTWKNAKNYSYYGTKLSNSVGGNFAMSPEISDLFTLPGDARNEMILAGQIYEFDAVTFAKTDIPYKYEGENVVLTKDIEIEDPEYLAVTNDVKGYSQGYKSVKWFIVDSDFMNGRNQSNDLPILRYADVIMMKAEAILRGATATNGDTPMSLLNKIRAYNNAPLFTTAPTLKDLLDERGREFFDENWRRNDLIRFGLFESEYGAHKKDMKYANFDPRHRIFPIPTSVLNKNEEWKQNPGY